MDQLGSLLEQATSRIKVLESRPPPHPPPPGPTMLFPRMPTRLGPPPPAQNWIDLNAALGPSSRSSPSVGERPGELRPQVDGHEATGSILGTHPAQHAAGMTLSLHPAPSHLHRVGFDCFVRPSPPFPKVDPSLTVLIHGCGRRIVRSISKFMQFFHL
jgi:hypothetical protein